MSKQSQQKRSWLDEVKADAEKITKRRLADDGLEMHEEKEKAINEAEVKTEAVKK